MYGLCTSYSGSWVDTFDFTLRRTFNFGSLGSYDFGYSSQGIRNYWKVVPGTLDTIFERTLAVTLYLMPRLTKPWINWAT